MSTFTKIDDNIIHSTVWLNPPHIKHTWTTMLFLSDKDGIVSASILNLAHQTGFSIEQTKEALKYFMTPDPYSRTKDFEGRRIEEIEGGWKLLNHKKYRGETREERIKRQSRESTQRHRASRSVTVTGCDACDTNTVTKRHSDACDCHQIRSDQIRDPDLNFSNEKFLNKRDLTSLGSIGSQSSSPLLASSLTNGDLLLETYDNKSKLKKTKKTKRKKRAPTTEGSHVWESYSRAYEDRYDIKPVRNAKQNSLCAKLVDRLGMEDAIGVAAYYPSVRNAFDVARGHALEILLKDCEKHCTAWKTGRQITQSGAREDDRLKASGDSWQRIIEKYADDEKEKPVIVGSCTVESRTQSPKQGVMK